MERKPRNIYTYLSWVVFLKCSREKEKKGERERNQETEKEKKNKDKDRLKKYVNSYIF